MGDITLYWYTSMPVVSCFMWNGALGSSGVLLSYSIISLASPMTCQYTAIYPLLNIHIYIFISSDRFLALGTPYQRNL